jgi:hypothetical protein
MLVNKSTSFLASDSPYEGDRESNPNPISVSTSLPTYEIPSTTTPLLVTPVIEPIDNPPKGSGASVVTEPDLGTPIVKNDTPSPIGTGNTPSPVGSGSGAGSGIEGGTSVSMGAGAMKNGKKKPNYVLYLGILLAVIVAYKLLSSKKEN